MRSRSPRPHWVCIALLVALASFGAACRRGPAAEPNESKGARATTEAEALADFKERANAYAALQKKLSANLGPLDETLSPTEISSRERSLGRAIIDARTGARRGDIFTPAAGALFQAAIREEFSHRSQLVLEERDEAQDELPNFTPMVNQIYPTTYPLATFPAGVLKRLPVLPDPLEYRFVQRNLILRDVHANLIVDVLPDAAPPMDALTPSR